MKKRCDEQKPACRNCRVGNRVCITTDPRKPGAPQVPRRRARRRPSFSDKNQEGIETAFDVNDGTTPATSALAMTPNASNQSSDHESGRGRVVRASQAPPETSGNRIPIQNGIPQLNQVMPQDNIQAALNDDETSARKKFLGASSLQVFAQWVDIVMVAHGHKDLLSADFRFGMRHAEELDMPLQVNLPPLAGIPNVQNYINIYLSQINPIYPFVDAQFVSTAVSKFSSPESIGEMASSDAAEVACLYAIISTAISETENPPSGLAATLIEAAFSLYGHLVGHPYLTSVQALGVMAIALRGRLKDGAAAQAIGQALRIAHSIGLHREELDAASNPESLERRVWKACYIFERNLEFETGRPPALQDDVDRQEIPISDGHDNEDPDYVDVLFHLARIQGKISKSVFSECALHSSPDAMMPVLSKFDAELIAWTDMVPEVIR
jgi:hypothetical protein